MAANPQKGEVGFEHAGNEFILRFSINSLCVLEDRLNQSVTEIGQALFTTPRLSVVRAVFWAGLQDNHPGVTEVMAGDMIGEIGTSKVGQLIGSAFFKAFPAAEEGKTARPQKPPAKKAAAGTGNAST